jgi:hypothetical protein
MKKNKSQKPTSIVEIMAEYMYLVIIGEKDNLKDFVNNLKNNVMDDKKKFIITRLDVPILFEYDKIRNTAKKELIVDMGIESAQSYAYAQEPFILPRVNKKKQLKMDHTENYMLMIIDDNILRFPKIDLTEEDPEKMIIDWMKKYNGGTVPEKFIKTIKPLSLVGFDDEILVYSGKI